MAYGEPEDPRQAYMRGYADGKVAGSHGYDPEVARTRRMLRISALNAAVQLHASIPDPDAYGIFDEETGVGPESVEQTAEGFLEWLEKTE